MIKLFADNPLVHQHVRFKNLIYKNMKQLKTVGTSRFKAYTLFKFINKKFAEINT
jgi:hypothetical protein